MAIRLYDWSTKQVNIFAEGAVLRVIKGESIRIGFDDWGTADFALYWKADENRPAKVMLNEYSYSYGGDQSPKSFAEVDATEEVRATYRAYLFEQSFNKLMTEAQDHAAVPRKGSMVEVVAGRTGKGTKGKVVAIIQRPYNAGWRSTMQEKVAIATSDVMVMKMASNGKAYANHRDVVWVWARNVKVTDLPEIDVAELQQMAERQANAIYAQVA